MNSQVFDNYPLTIREYSMGTEITLAELHRVILDFLRGRKDVALFGAQAVNAYVDAPRMTVDVDVMSVSAEQFASEVCQHLHDRLQIAARIRTVASGKGFRVYQLQTPDNRHLVDVRQVIELPPCRLISGILVIQPPDLIAQKLIAMVARKNTPKSLTDQVDIMRLLLAFPVLKAIEGEIVGALLRNNAAASVYRSWQELVESNFTADSDEDY